jgi:hypothetical protein
MIETKVKLRIACEVCEGTGRIPSQNKGGLYDTIYCPDCRGEKSYEVWISITKFKAMLDRLG